LIHQVRILTKHRKDETDRAALTNIANSDLSRNIQLGIKGTAVQRYVACGNTTAASHLSRLVNQSLPLQLQLLSSCWGRAKCETPRLQVAPQHELLRITRKPHEYCCVSEGHQYALNWQVSLPGKGHRTAEIRKSDAVDPKMWRGG
jgi:hypothetical protein